VLAGAHLDGAVAAGGADELPDGPAGALLDEAGDGQGGEDDGQVGLDGVPFAVVVVAADDEVRAARRASG
jgi:hypothetical protein